MTNDNDPGMEAPMSRTLNWQRTFLAAAAVTLPGLMLLGLVVLAKGKSPGPAAKLSAGAEPTEPTRTADGMPVARTVPRDDAFRVVGRFVREQYDARKRGRELARRATELVESLARLDRFPTMESTERAAALFPRPRRPNEAPPPADVRQAASDEGLGIFVLDQVRAGRTGHALGEEIQDEVVRRKRAEAEARSAEERIAALEAKQKAEAEMKVKTAAATRPAERMRTGKKR
jgi:hypothetical protein